LGAPEYFDHLVGAAKQRNREGEAERLGFRTLMRRGGAPKTSPEM
jgi:hypothetical protein